MELPKRLQAKKDALLAAKTALKAKEAALDVAIEQWREDIRETRNEITKPKKGTASREVWDWCDTYPDLAKNVSEVVNRFQQIPRNSVHVYVHKWRKFNAPSS